MSAPIGFALLLSLLLSPTDPQGVRYALDRHDVVGMQNDSPAISVWSGPISNDAIDQRSANRGPDDEN